MREFGQVTTTKSEFGHIGIDIHVTIIPTGIVFAIPMSIIFIYTYRYTATMVNKMMYDERRRRFQDLLERYPGQLAASTALGFGSAAAVSNYKTHKNMGEDVARRIEKLAGLPHGALLDPFKTPWPGDAQLNSNQEPAALQLRDARARYEVNTSAAITPTGRIPLISKVQAGGWGDAVDHFSIGDAESYHETNKKHGTMTYALRVEGDSMWSGMPSGPSYHHGDIIIVDPEQSAAATSGSRVIALLTDESLPIDRRVTFKQLVIDGPHKYLRPLNKDYEAIREPFEVIGLVLQCIRPD